MTAKAKPQRRCRTCGEPEMVGLSDSGQFGWFTVEEDGRFATYCMRCGSNPLARPRQALAAK